MQRAGTSQLILYGRDGRRKYVTPAERQRFIDIANSWPRAEVGTLCLTLALTGCRISEALGLFAGSIERDESVVVIRSLKKRGGIVFRQVPVPDHYLDRMMAVHELATAEPDAPLWTLSRTQAWTLIKRVMQAAGIRPGPHATPKGLRHGFGIHALRSGVPVTLVKRYLGHSRLETTEIYLDVVGDEERELASRMWSLVPETHAASIHADSSAASDGQDERSGSSTHGHAAPVTGGGSPRGTKSGKSYGTLTASCAGSTRLASAQGLVQLRPLRAAHKGLTSDPPPTGRGHSRSHTPGMVPGEHTKTGEAKMTKEKNKPTQSSGR